VRTRGRAAAAAGTSPARSACGAQRLVSYDIFPPPEDILWPNGIGFSALAANAETGKALAGLLIDRLTAIIDQEFPEG
jgi:hypothetical protein